MKKRNQKNPAQTKTPTARASDAGSGWIGRDVLGEFQKKRFSIRVSVPLILFVVVAALALVVLRSDVIRIRYALSEAMDEERRLLEEQRAYTVTMRRLRAPGHLVRLARERGFARPEHIIYLEDDGPAPQRTLP